MSKTGFQQDPRGKSIENDPPRHSFFIPDFSRITHPTITPSNTEECPHNPTRSRRISYVPAQFLDILTIMECQQNRRP